jgi:hypothetical protein
MTPRFDDIPREPLVLLVITPDHRAYIDGTPLEVPAGTDPRIAAANAAIARAQQLGHALRAVLDDADGQRWPMILTPEGGVFQATRPLRDTPPSDLHDARQQMPTPKADNSEDSGPTPPTVTANPAPPGADRPTGLNGHSQPPADPHETRLIRVRETDLRPPEGIDPGSVPAWPLVTIVLTEEGKAFVNDTPVNQPPGVEPRAAAVAAAAEHIAQLGLARPVRANATEPDGTVWPLLIHPDGTATAAGEPIRPERGRRWSRRKS